MSLIDSVRFAFHAYVEGSVEGDRVIVRLFVDAPDFPGAVGRPLAFLSKGWNEPGERVVVMEMRKSMDSADG